MKIILASNNKGKLKELKMYMKNYEVYGFTEVLEPFEIIEDGKSFKENALIKARTVYKKLDDKKAIVLSDDSGISVEALDGKPGIYSARYAGTNASSEQNLNKLISALKQKNL
ncbi:MAG: non-canonical purine NTP pyrophosphatase, partial [Epsilonproteobacteria bacterium]|nr:non-canonical purine NTP pyrophosphatase [Campylobacterota bacterium]